MDELLKLLLEKGFDVAPVLDGQYHRFHRNGKEYAGWFKGIEVRDAHDQVLWMEAEFGDWVTREKHTWTGGQAECNLTPEQLEERRIMRAELAEKTRAEKLRRQEMAAADALRMYRSGTPKPEAHPYVKRKQIDVGTVARGLSDKLMLPVFVGSYLGECKISSLQLIGEDGAKKFLSGGRLDLGYTIFTPSWNPCEDFSVLHIAEGYATAASIGMALHCTVLVAFNTSNLVKLCRALQENTGFTPSRVVICADNDGGTKGNPGMAAAHEARDALVKQGIECSIRAPQASEGTSCDWNDFHCANGLEATRKALTGEVTPPDNSTKSEVPPVHTHTPTAQLPALADFEQVKVRLNEKGKPIPPTQKQVVDLLLGGFGDSLMRDGKNVFLWSATHWFELDKITFEYFITQAGMRILHGQGTERGLKDIYKLFLAYLPAVPPGQSFYRQDPRLSNFLDGTLELARDEDSKYTMRFREHRREDLLSWVLPYEYKGAGGQNELFTSWLLRCFEGDPDANGKVRALAQIGGACLVSLFPRYVFLYGPGGTGKSTFAKLCMRFLSPSNVCSVEPKDQGETFGKEIMVNKLANIVTDISGARIDSALFKRAEDRVPEYINRKNIGAVMGYLPSLNIFCSNILPKGIDSESSALDRRVTIVEFLQSLVADGKYTRDYDLVLLKSGPGAILKFFLGGLQDLCDSGGIYFNPESGAAKLKAWKDSESLAAQFVDAITHGEIEGLSIDPGAEIERKKVGEALALWSGRPLPNQAVGHLFSDLAARGFRLKMVGGKRYVCGLGSGQQTESTRF